MTGGMVFRTADPGEEEAIFHFYQSILDKRTDKDYKLWWNLEVYPTRKDYSEAVGNNTMHLAMEENRIVGAAMLNDNQVEGYDVTEWVCNPDPAQIAVIHLVAIDPDQRGKASGGH